MLAFSLFGKAMAKPIESEKEVFSMLVGLEGLKASPCRKVIILLIAWILCIGLEAFTLHQGTASRNMVKLPQTEVPLLLNSGVVQTNKAEVSVILWFENGDVPLGISTKGPKSDWVWNHKRLETETGKVAVTLSGHCLIDKNEESNLYTWYNIMAQQLTKTGGQIYLDERVPQAIDISAYLSQTNALPSQWSLLGNTLSIAAYQKSLETSVMAGKDRVNIQLLSRGQNTEGQTVLAIPVLLEEF